MFKAKIYTYTEDGTRVFLGKTPIDPDVIGFMVYIPDRLARFSPTGRFEVRLPGLFARLFSGRLLRIMPGDEIMVVV